MCELHTKVLILESDKESLKLLLDKAEKDSTRYSNWWHQERDKVSKSTEALNRYKRRTKKLIELVRSKWWVRGKLLKILLNEGY
jgi:hypothetical protein